VKVYVAPVAEYIVQPVVDGVPANIGLCVATAVPLELTTIDWQAVGKLVGKVIVFDPDTSCQSLGTVQELNELEALAKMTTIVVIS
jgi:hypothetical protein